MAFGILFRRTSNSHADPNIDRVKWKRFDVVCVYEPNQCRDNPHPDSPHAILVVTDGPNADRARRHLCTDYRSGGGTILGRAKWIFSPPQLPAPVRQALQQNGRAPCTFEEFQGACFDRETGLNLRDSGGIPEGAQARG